MVCDGLKFILINENLIVIFVDFIKIVCYIKPNAGLSRRLREKCSDSDGTNFDRVCDVNHPHVGRSA